MTLRLIPALMAAMLCLASCSDYGQPQPVLEQEEYTYSFTAVLPGIDTRMSYQEDPKTGNLKMVWDKGDVIRLYPDASMNDPKEYYEFIANTGAGTSHTVFVHQGYIPNWEHWSGKAIYLFPNGDNLDVSHNSTEFLAKAYVQKKNGDKEHLKYAEHVLGQDGSKQYTEYWSQNLVDANLKHDHQMTFAHQHTVVYKVMLRGFIFDIPGGSQLRMSGDAWEDEEETILTLGSKEDKEPFLKVGEYGKENYEDNVLTAYIIRQVTGDVDGSIKKDEKLKFELFTYDELDGTVIPLDEKDTMRRGNPAYEENYLTNVPWGDEYTWNVTATKDIEYNAGDFVVADLTDTSKDYAYPKIAVDLGLPLKWAAFNVGAKKIDENGEYVVWGRNTKYSVGGNLLDIYGGEWSSGDPTRDAATYHWGNEWRTPTFNEFLDLVHYASWLDGVDQEAADTEARWKGKEDLKYHEAIFHFNVHPAHQINDVKAMLVKSIVNDKYIYLPIAGFLSNKIEGVEHDDRTFYCTSSSRSVSSSDRAKNTMMIALLQESPYSGSHRAKFYIGYSYNYYSDELINAESLRAVKYR